jgi:hypothetical protein
LELEDYLLEIRFKVSESVHCLFIQTNDDGSKIYHLNYVDNILCHGMSDPGVKWFVEMLQKRFSVEFMGQAHWYFLTCINQLSNEIELDQS